MGKVVISEPSEAGKYVTLKIVFYFIAGGLSKGKRVRIQDRAGRNILIENIIKKKLLLALFHKGIPGLITKERVGRIQRGVLVMLTESQEKPLQGGSGPLTPVKKGKMAQPVVMGTSE